MAVRTGISPNELMNADLEVFARMIERINEESEHARRQHQG